MIVGSILAFDDTSGISINGSLLKGSADLFEQLTRKSVNRGVFTTDDLKRFKAILQFTNAHLQGHEPGGNVQTSRGPMFREVI